MTKLKRSVEAWVKRVRMSRFRVWAVVEGASRDVPFYESLLVQGAHCDSVSVIQASDLEVDGSCSGGKSHSLKIFRALQGLNGLEQENNATIIDVIFFLDRDDDDYLGLLETDPHVAYTSHADVEAEIASHTCLQAAVAHAFSISRTDAERAIPGSAISDLANIWSEWIALRLAAEECDWGGARFAQSSKINVPKFGEVDPELQVKVCTEITKEDPDGWRDALERARAHVFGLMASGKGARLVKGKWLTEYIAHLVASDFSGERPVPKVSRDQFMSTCSVSVDYEKVWVAYQGQLDQVLAK